MAKRSKRVRKSTKRRSASTRQRAATRQAVKREAQAEPIELSNDEVERALQSGEHSGALRDFFGPAQYAELRNLAQEAAARGARRSDERVLIVPGIMGSKLGFDGFGPFDDVIWANPIAIALGRLRELALGKGKSKVEALGVILFAYLKLKLKLKIDGHDADFFAYDWRQSLPDLGKLLAAELNSGGRKTQLVAHSMGGLVARAALAHKPKHLGRVIMLGTPNFGSFAPIQAFRGADSLLQKIDFIDTSHDAAGLAAIFGTFPGLCEMIPSPTAVTTNFFDLASWPKAGPRPAQALLTAALNVQTKLPVDFKDLIIIAGVDQTTVVDARVDDGEFVYTESIEGDGTVPLKCVAIPGIKTYYVVESHGSLPNNGDVARAVDAILQTGETTHLPDRYQPSRSRGEFERREKALSPAVYDGTEGRALSAQEKRTLIDEVVAPDRKALGAPLEGATTPAVTLPPSIEQGVANAVIVGRKRQQRLDVTLALGSITEVQSEAYVLGVFNLVAPAGAASAIDAKMGGAIQEMFDRRMFNAGVGEISIMPTGKHPVRADLIAFAGLGAFDRFNEDVLEIVGENLVRTFIKTCVSEFATVPIGGATGAFTAGALRKLLTGFLRGLQDSGINNRFRGITICETDKDRYAALVQEFYRIIGTTLFDGTEVTLHQMTLPEPMVEPMRRAATATAQQSTFLIVRQEADRGTTADYAWSVLTAGAKATVYKARNAIEKKKLTDHLAVLGTRKGLSYAALPDFGAKLAGIIMPPSIHKILERELERPLVVVHDAATSRIPWETLKIGDKFPALEGGLSHRYEADDLAIAKWLENRQLDSSLDVLLIVDPTDDLDGAEEEGRRIFELLDKLKPRVKVVALNKAQARKDTILDHFRSGKFDVVHYAGHAEFDPERPNRSGIRCAGGELLSGADLVNLGSLPSLMFLNACESGRLRRGSRRPLNGPERVQSSFSFAEAFLRGGIANYLGTYWPVNDGAALTFSQVFYQEILLGRSLSTAIMSGRKAVDKGKSADWADYILYGNPEFVLKLPS
jgi:pimeloyl-ACP methyl ester carboxylesterase